MHFLRFFQVLALSCVLLTSCVKEKPSTAKFLTLACWGSADELKVLKDNIKEFEKRHSVQVRIISIPVSRYGTKLLLMFSGNVPPDLFYVLGTRRGKYASRGAVMDLTPFIEEDEDMCVEDFLPQLVEASK